MTSPETCALVLQGVTKTLERGGVRFSLHVPELKVRPGEFVAVVGRSGCGKSTLLDIVGLIRKPDQAGVLSFGRRDGGATDLARASDAARAQVRRSLLGYVLQAGGLLPFLNARENIRYAAILAGLPHASDEINSLAGALGIGDQLTKKPQYLSGGQRQRVAIARAIVHRPALLLADEPTGAVDQDTAQEIVTQMKSLARERGTAVLMVTHDLPLVRQLAERLIGFELERPGPHHTVSICRVLPPAG